MFQSLLDSPEKITLYITIFIAIWQVGKTVLRFVSPMTKDFQGDDKVLAFMEKVEGVTESEWVKEVGRGFWAEIEALEKKGEIKGGIYKYSHFIFLARKAYLNATGKALSQTGEILLEQLARKWSAEAKVSPPDPIKALAAKLQSEPIKVPSV